MSWDAIGDELRRWHAAGDRAAVRSALAVLEPELRRMVPVLARRTWPGDVIEDALRGFLVKVIEVPLPPGSTTSAAISAGPFATTAGLTLFARSCRLLTIAD
jgi:hypothetical protein